VAAILHPASFFGIIVALATSAGPALAQQPPATQAQVCERPAANGASESSSNECCCAAPVKIACCTAAPQGLRKECFADEFQLVLPVPFRSAQAVLSANGALVLGPRTTVRARAVGEKEVGFGAIANLGEEDTLVGADASVGALISDSKVTTLADGVTVNGALTAAGALVVPATAVLKGHVTTNTHTPAVSPPLATVTFTAEPALNVVGGSTRALAPGRYGETRVEAGATLSLTTGTYYLTSLAVAPGATLALDERAGAVVVFVKTNVAFAGEERQEGSDGHVLIAAFGCEPTFLSAPFRGTVSAQNAWLSMIAPPKLAFAGRFFANSIDVGAETTIGGLGLTLPGPTQVAGVPPPQPPTPLPKPPPRPGCYEMTPNGWRPVPCATDAFIDSRFGHPDAQLALSSFATPSLVFGQVEVTVPQVASEQNGFLASTASIPGCTSSGSPVPNQWSVQNNTNLWTIASGADAGDVAGDQFVVMSDGSVNGICIWQVDVTSQTYPKTCYADTHPPSLQRSGGLQAFDFGNIAATATGGMLGMVASLSWVAPGQPNTYAVVAADAFDLGNNWNAVGGGLLGINNCAQAQFTNAEVVTQVATSTCAGDTSATSPTCAPPTLQPNASAFVGTLGTVETNNLTAIGGSPSVSYPNSDLAVTSMTATTSGNCLGPSHAYVKDSVDDFGATPSTLGAQVFWESPDIFLVPHGTPVTLDAVSTETTITPGGQYDIWVRVHNDLGCSDVTNIKTLVYLADPAALSIQWGPVTNGQYVGNNGSSTGVTAPASGEALIGPLPFTAPTSGIGNGHRCILAAIQASGESAPANQYGAPDSNQVAQRNIQFASPCVFPLTNATTSNGSAQITLTVTPNTAAAPSLTAQPDVEVAFDDPDSSWFNVWTAQTGNGSTFKVTHSGAMTTVRLGAYSVALNQVSIAAGQSRNATGTTVLPSGYPTALTLEIGATLTETTGSGTVLVQNGGSCVTPPPPVIESPK